MLYTQIHLEPVQYVCIMYVTELQGPLSSLKMNVLILQSVNCGLVSLQRRLFKEGMSDPCTRYIPQL